MCRLFAYVAPSISTADRELGEDGIESILSLARLHGDGWGWAGVNRPGEAPVAHKSPRSAATDPEFRRTIATPGRAAMLHLRWATLGLLVELRNAHPFRFGGITFEHNGSLKPIGRAQAMLSPDALARMTGDTDSEMYFALIQEQVDAGLDLPAATLGVVRRLREAFPLSSLNGILLDRDQLIVVHASARSVLSDDDLDAISRLGGLPGEHNEDYFTLRWKRSRAGAVLMSSTGVAGTGWAPLPAESVTTVRLDDGTMRSELLNAMHAEAA